MPSTSLPNLQPTKRSGDKHETNSLDTQTRQAAAGACAGCVTRAITQPFDVLKIRFQLQVEPVWMRSNLPEVQSKYTSMTQAIRVILKEEGMRAFWKGHNPGQVMSILYGVAQFWSYEQIYLGVRQMPSLREHRRVASFLSGGIAGCFATFITAPFDVIRTRLVAQDSGAGYRNSISAVPHILKSEGIGGLFRGLAVTLIQIGPLVGSNFWAYETMNEFAKKTLEPENGNLPTWVLLANGGTAGVVSKAIVYPLDFIKKRLQLKGFERNRQTFGRNQGCSTILTCVRLTLEHEGYLGFYKGMMPTLVKSGLTTALYFSVYDQFKAMFITNDQKT